MCIISFWMGIGTNFKFYSCGYCCYFPSSSSFEGFFHCIVSCVSFPYHTLQITPTQPRTFTLVLPGMFLAILQKVPWVWPLLISKCLTVPSNSQLPTIPNFIITFARCQTHQRAGYLPQGTYHYKLQSLWPFSVQTQFENNQQTSLFN